MKKLCYIATIPAVVHAFLRPHIQAATEQYEVTVVCNAVDRHLLSGLNARLIFLSIERKPSPVTDIHVFFQLFNLFRREKFDIVHSIMPKTGVLAMLAAYFARIPVRIHTFTGQVWVTKHGLQRFLLKRFDMLVGCFATCTLADSPSQRDFLINQGVISKDKAVVIGAGSICGVDLIRFQPNSEVKRVVRDELRIAHDSKIILFVGRLNRDKGMLDLASAFNSIAHQRSDVELLLVGAEEDISFNRIQEECYAARGHLHYMSFTSAPERYMAAADIFCLPSYREGFGMTIIEAAACGVPAVASRIYGVTDAVENGKTGLLFPVGDVSALAHALLKLIENESLRQQMAYDARERVRALFSGERVTCELMMLYEKLKVKS